MTAFPIHETSGEPELEHLHITWKQANALSLALVRQIDTHCKDTGERFDRIVTVPRGGLHVATFVSRAFRIEAPEILNMSLTSYDREATSSAGTFRRGQEPAQPEVEGLRILVPDDVVDSGKTEKEIKMRLCDMGAITVRLASLHDKPDRHEVDVSPDFVAAVVRGNVWIHYPWEELEEILEDEPSVWSGVEYGSRP
jgi:hypoxanthine phosphoribosyltransferase